MADQKISAMVSMGALDGTEIIAGVKGGVNARTTPDAIRSYIVAGASVAPKVYVASLSQAGTADPAPDYFVTYGIGNIVWTRSGAGRYVGTLAGAFTVGKTVMFVNACPFNHDGTKFIECLVASNNTVYINTGLGGTGSDGVLDGSYIKIEVYP